MPAFAQPHLCGRLDHQAADSRAVWRILAPEGQVGHCRRREQRAHDADLGACTLGPDQQALDQHRRAGDHRPLVQPQHCSALHGADAEPVEAQKGAQVQREERAAVGVLGQRQLREWVQGGNRFEAAMNMPPAALLLAVLVLSQLNRQSSTQPARPLLTLPHTCPS